MIPDILYRKMKASTLQQPEIILKGSGQSLLTVKGMILVTLKFKEKTVPQELGKRSRRA